MVGTIFLMEPDAQLFLQTRCMQCSDLGIVAGSFSFARARGTIFNKQIQVLVVYAVSEGIQ